MVPILGVEVRNGIGSALSGLMVFMKNLPPKPLERAPVA